MRLMVLVDRISNLAAPKWAVHNSKAGGQKGRGWWVALWRVHKCCQICFIRAQLHYYCLVISKIFASNIDISCLSKGIAGLAFLWCPALIELIINFIYFRVCRCQSQAVIKMSIAIIPGTSIIVNVTVKNRVYHWWYRWHYI